jgi:hypothetical protein
MGTIFTLPTMAPVDLKFSLISVTVMVSWEEEEEQEDHPQSEERRES